MTGQVGEGDAFRPNGLLCGNSLFGSDTLLSKTNSAVEHDTGKDDAFQSNGLLGGNAPQESSNVADFSMDSESAGPESFVLNGLLGGPTSRLSPPLMQDEAGPSRARNVENGTSAPTSPLRSNGLLNSQQANNADGPLTQSQDDELPDIADILRPYARGKDDTSDSFGAPIVLPRSSIRSSTYDGKTVFLRRKPRRRAVGPAASSSSAWNQSMGKLLDVPLHRLMDELSVTEARRLASEDTQQPEQTPDSNLDSELWIDRYRPKRFVDLLGDERLHREVTTWVKEWDHCVFGKRKAKRKTREDEGGNYIPEDEYHRPHEKILLMSGPPGLGKTTLAHIVAKHSGYNVFEINASDARSGSIVDDRIRPALEAGFTIGNSKPNLIIIDEIDGATGAGNNASSFIQKLVQLTYDRPFKDRRKKQKGGKRPLLRPIICICNDLYAASLAKLRPVAKIVRFTRPADIHIVKRLRDVCEYEDLKAEPRALSALVAIALGDLRGCLNTLQFIKSRNQKVTEQMIRIATAGMKETESSFLNVLNNLFLPMSKKRIKELGLGEEEETKYVDRLSRELDASGALDRIATGCFEHYAKTHQHDGTFARYLKANECLVSYDLLSNRMRSEQDYALMPYLSYTLVPFYPLFQERGGERVERPKADWETYVKTKANEEIYKSLAHAVRTGNGSRTGHYRDLVSEQILHLEFAPYLNRIISPPLRPVNSQVIRPEEKAILSRLVNIMVSLELRFVQEKAEDGQLMYRLDPPIDVFVTYDGKRATDIAVSRYAVRHLVAAEIDAQLITRQAEAVERSKASRPSFFGQRPVEDDADAVERDGIEPDGEGTLGRAGPAEQHPRKKAKLIDIADRPAVDFFGRPIVPKAPTTGTKPNSVAARKQPEKAYKVSYKYNEGNSAAVRKPVKVSSFL